MVTVTDNETQRRFNNLFADQFAPDDARYVMACHECNTAIWRKQNSSYVKRARADDRTLGCSCGGEYEMVRDDRPT